MLYKIFNVILVGALLSCNDQSKSNNAKDNVKKDTISGTLHAEPLLAAAKTFSETFAIIAHDYDYENNNYGIRIKECEYANGQLASRDKKIDFGIYKDVLMLGKYNSLGAYYPVQFGADMNKVYLSIYKADEEEGIFYYNKILEYDLKSDSLREVVSLPDYLPSWYYAEPNNKIYGFDNTTRSLISVDILSGKIDTLLSIHVYLENIEYHQVNEGNIEVIGFGKESGVFKLEVNLTNDDVTKTDLYPVADFSSYHKGMVVETFKDFRNDKDELRLHTESDVKSIPFDFKNFNTYWINDSEFLVIKDNSIEKVNTSLFTVAVFRKEQIHIIEVLKNSLIISYEQDSDKKIGMLNFDFTHLEEIKEIDPSDIVAIRNIEEW